MTFYPPPFHDLNWRVGDRLDPRPPRIRGGDHAFRRRRRKR
jgi:hypothetical protein